MLKLLMDEDFRGPVLAGLRLHHPELDLVRAVEVGLGGLDDEVVLTWAAANDRITVSHDMNTMIDAANRRVRAGEPMSGLIVLRQTLEIGRAITELRLVAELATDLEMHGATIWLPV